VIVFCLLDLDQLLRIQTRQPETAEAMPRDTIIMA